MRFFLLDLSLDLISPYCHTKLMTALWWACRLDQHCCPRKADSLLFCLLRTIFKAIFNILSLAVCNIFKITNVGYIFNSGHLPKNKQLLQHLSPFSSIKWIISCKALQTYHYFSPARFSLFTIRKLRRRAGALGMVSLSIPLEKKKKTYFIHKENFSLIQKK